jgi:hypothetical protein
MQAQRGSQTDKQYGNLQQQREVATIEEHLRLVSESFSEVNPLLMRHTGLAFTWIFIPVVLSLLNFELGAELPNYRAVSEIFSRDI